MPRHPPCALISLTYSRIMSCFSTEELFEIVFYPLNFFNWISLISSLLFRYSIFKEHLSLANIWSPWVLFGGDEENRTPDPLLARQVLSQLSYTPVWTGHQNRNLLFSTFEGALPAELHPQIGFEGCVVWLLYVVSLCSGFSFVFVRKRIPAELHPHI